MAYDAWSVVFGEQPSAAKWNILGTNDSSFNDGTGIATGKILPNHLLTAASTLNTHVWDTWTPTFTNVSGGTLNYSKYIQIGKTIHFRLRYTLAGAGVSGGVIFSTPTSINAGLSVAITDAIIGTGLVGISGSWYPCTVNFATSTTLQIFCFNASATYATLTTLSSTIPNTFGNGSTITVSGSYEAA